jgi:two-component system sensor histidine kinase LytS
MEGITLVLFERTGLLLILTFILTRIPLFRQLLDKEMNLRNSVVFSIIFGLFGIAGTYSGVVINQGTVESFFWIDGLNSNEILANSSLVGVVIGGLLGGLRVGAGAGLITGLHSLWLGGFASVASGVAAPVTGLLAGSVARFFSNERVVSPMKALFIGMFAPILYMGLILIFSSPPEEATRLVNMIGIPMVTTNSIAIAIFTTMIHVVLKEEERAAAVETQRALKIAEMTLPHLKQGLTPKTAEATALILWRELKAAAVAITDTEYILAYVGIGTSQQVPGESIRTNISRKALRTGKIQIAQDPEDIQPQLPLLGASIIVPFRLSGKIGGLIKIYFNRPQQIRKVEEILAEGLGKLISYQLDAAHVEKMSGLMKDAELRVLQAQINPHFLFNTLNSIHSLIRTDPDAARHVTRQLSTFMRLNIKLTQSQLIPLSQELEHLQAYLEIIRVRFDEQFKVRCKVGQGIENVLIPPATFQPLVENSIQHGLKEVRKGGEIIVCIVQGKDGMNIIIEDNGSGVPPEVLENLGKKPIREGAGNGIGVYNVNQRLISLFGTEAAMDIENKASGGCKISFTIPLHREGEN